MLRKWISFAVIVLVLASIAFAGYRYWQHSQVHPNTEDAYVSPRALAAFCAKVKDCRDVLLEGARHEMLIETDAIRDRVLQEIRGFI